MNNRFKFINSLIKVTVLSAVIVYGIIEAGKYLSSVKPLKISEPELAQTDIDSVSSKDDELKKTPAAEKKIKKTVKKVPKKSLNTEIQKVKTEDINEEAKDKIEYSFKVEKLKVIQLPDDKVIRMTFRLKNRTKGIRVKGRMFIKFYRGNTVYFYPETGLAEGTPLEIEKGVFYNIKKYKRVEVIIDRGVDLKQFSDVEFFIYEDSNGTVPVYRENHKLIVESGDIFKNPY